MVDVDGSRYEARDVHKFDNGTAIGAMVSAPFGLKTEYDRDWVGRYYAATSDVQKWSPRVERRRR